MASDQKLREALAEQEEELRKLDERLIELRPLQQRRDNVYQLVTQMRFLLGLPTVAHPPVTESQEESPGKVGDRPIWAVSRDILRREKRPMAPGEIAEILRGLGFEELLGRKGRESVRTLLKKKTDVFEKLEGGKFKLKET